MLSRSSKNKINESSTKITLSSFDDYVALPSEGDVLKGTNIELTEANANIASFLPPQPKASSFWCSFCGSDAKNLTIDEEFNQVTEQLQRSVYAYNRVFANQELNEAKIHFETMKLDAFINRFSKKMSLYVRGSSNQETKELLLQVLESHQSHWAPERQRAILKLEKSQALSRQSYLSMDRLNVKIAQLHKRASVEMDEEIKQRFYGGPARMVME